MMRVVPGASPTVLAASSSWIGTNWMTVDATHVFFTACDVGACDHVSLYRIARTGASSSGLIWTR